MFISGGQGRLAFEPRPEDCGGSPVERKEQVKKIGLACLRLGNEVEPGSGMSLYLFMKGVWNLFYQMEVALSLLAI